MHSKLLRSPSLAFVTKSISQRSFTVPALSSLGKNADHSWLQQLSADPEAEDYSPNRYSRQVRSGHYVPVLPQPLAKPKLVIHSPNVAQDLGISDGDVKSDSFVDFFSGNQGCIPSLRSWCTPYALSIMGQPQYSNCPFGNGNGYGDGRIISVGELLIASRRWEMQIKGGGTTPFCRGFDGRAVLRSSVREFLASEAMHNLGVETTRALCLIVSETDVVARPWYSGRPRMYGMRNPDTMVKEPCAITTRVAPSFLRVGHLDLFARRVRNSNDDDHAKKELVQIVNHAMFREFPDALLNNSSSPDVVTMLEMSASRLAAMVAGWLRVGFSQGNFNADNCLIAGRTMDYGPFGWIEKYDPLFATWTGAGEHFGFMNQPTAAMHNYHTLVHSVLPVLQGSDGDEENIGSVAQDLVDRGVEKIGKAAMDTFRIKMGLPIDRLQDALELWRILEPLMKHSEVDYTIFWRQLAAALECVSEEQMLAQISRSFYGEAMTNDSLRLEWQSWLKKWSSCFDKGDWQNVATQLRTVNPKYVPREWMLVDAYKAAYEGDYKIIHELHELFLRPYDEQLDFEARYYRRAPIESLEQPGCAFMS